MKIFSRLRKSQKRTERKHFRRIVALWLHFVPPHICKNSLRRGIKYKIALLCLINMTQNCPLLQYPIIILVEKYQNPQNLDKTTQHCAATVALTLYFVLPHICKNSLRGEIKPKIAKL